MFEGTDIGIRSFTVLKQLVTCKVVNIIIWHFTVIGVFVYELWV